MGENALVAWLAQRFPADPQRVRVGIGDDMAVLRADRGVIAITADMLLDGVHFDTRRHPYPLIGRKAIACSLSDCAAMACQPVAATVSLALPHRIELDQVKLLYEGMAGIADEFGCRIVGGDTTGWEGRLAIDVAMLAEPMSPRGPIRRSTAHVGDTLFVSGRLGGSIRERHLTFVPRLALARALADQPGVHALMDLSDGLSMDLHRMCEASGCDAELDASAFEHAIHEDCRQPGAALVEARAHALNDGEDFELLVAGAAELDGLALSLIPVGRMVPREVSRPTRITLVTVAGPESIEPRGYEHLT